MDCITFVMIVKNGSNTLKSTLEALKQWPHVLVVDTGSTDSTLEMAQGFKNVILKQIPFEGFGKTRNRATSFSPTDWVFHIDADELVTQKLTQELKHLALDPQKVYQVLRDNYFLNKQMKGCSGWYPDPVIRLFNRNHFAYGNEAVHEKLVCQKTDVISLKGHLLHTPYQNFHQMLSKMNHYSELFAQNSSKQVSMWSPYVHGGFAFIKSYFFKLGFTQGYRGLILSKYIADTAFYKYLKLVEKKYF